MHKDAYGGMKIAYPEEDIYIGNDVVPTSARDIAAQMVEQRKAGGTITYPSTLDMQGNPKWRIEEATTANNPQHILQYPKDCDDEIRIGMEIPDDVISNDGSGAWAGKRIPLAAFYAGLDSWVVQLLADLRHTLEPLILMNWGRAEDFEICHKPLALQAMEQQGQASSAPPAQSAQAPVTTARRSFSPTQPPDRSAQRSMLSGSSPHRMSLNPVRAPSTNEQADRYQRAHLMAALLTRIYGPEAERYFDEAFGTNCRDTNSYSTSTRHPYEFQRMSAQISRSVGLAGVPWDPLKHPRGRDGRFIEKYGAGAFTAAQSKINNSLDPDIAPQSTRVSDDIRPLLEHFNLLDHSQLHNLASDYQVSPNQASHNPLADAVHHLLYGEAPKLGLSATDPHTDLAQDGNFQLVHFPEPADKPTVARVIVDPDTGEEKTITAPNPYYKDPNKHTVTLHELLGLPPEIHMPKLPDPLDQQINIHKYETNTIVYRIWKTFGGLTYRQLNYLESAYARAAEIGKDIFYNKEPKSVFEKQCYQYAVALENDALLKSLFAKAGFKITSGYLYTGHQGIYVYREDENTKNGYETDKFFTIHVGSGPNPLHHTPWGSLWPIKTSFPGDWLEGIPPHGINSMHAANGNFKEK